MSETSDRSVPFAAMAERIKANAGDAFGGAFVIVAPDGSLLSTLILDPSSNPAMFWGTIKGKADIALSELEQQERAAQPMRGYR